MDEPALQRELCEKLHGDFVLPDDAKAIMEKAQYRVRREARSSWPTRFTKRFCAPPKWWQIHMFYKGVWRQVGRVDLAGQAATHVGTWSNPRQYIDRIAYGIVICPASVFVVDSTTDG